MLVEPNITDCVRKLTQSLYALPDNEQLLQELVDLLTACNAREETIVKTVASLISSIDDIRLKFAYLSFDLDATKRERDYLLGLLNGQSEN